MWSKLVYTHAGRVAKAAYDCNDLPYHNWQHILDCYEYLHENQVTYSEALDGAVLFHDVVYKPSAEDNEEQSAQWFLDRFPEVGCKNVIANMIRGTKTHDLSQKLDMDIRDFDWLCRADLEETPVLSGHHL
jgi:predicted metal-dependent HD superfamily phosphohydrolase